MFRDSTEIASAHDRAGRDNYGSYFARSFNVDPRDDGFYYKKDKKVCRWYYVYNGNLIAPQKFTLSRFEKSFVKSNKIGKIVDKIKKEQERILSEYGNIMCEGYRMLRGEHGEIEEWYGGSSMDSMVEIEDSGTYVSKHRYKDGTMDQLIDIQSHEIFRLVEKKDIQTIEKLNRLYSLRRKRTQKIASFFLQSADRIIRENQEGRKSRDMTTNIVALYTINGKQYQFLFDNYHYHLAFVNLVINIDHSIAKMPESLRR